MTNRHSRWAWNVISRVISFQLSLAASFKSARGCFKILRQCKGLFALSQRTLRKDGPALGVRVATLCDARGRPLDGDNAHPFPRLLYVFPPLLRILCRDKFFLRRIKILEGHSEYLARRGKRYWRPHCEQNRLIATYSILKLSRSEKKKRRLWHFCLKERRVIMHIRTSSDFNGLDVCILSRTRPWATFKRF